MHMAVCCSCQSENVVMISVKNIMENFLVEDYKCLDCDSEFSVEKRI